MNKITQAVQFNSSSKTPHSKNGSVLSPCNLPFLHLLLRLLAFSLKLLVAFLPIVKPLFSTNTLNKAHHLKILISSLIHSKPFLKKRVENSMRGPGYLSCIKLRKWHVLLRDGCVEYALKLLDEMFQPLSDVPPDEGVSPNTKWLTVMEATWSADHESKQGQEKGMGIATPTVQVSKGPRRSMRERKGPKALLCRSGKFNQAGNLLNELLGLQATLEIPPFNAL
ncbi:hypothetical protein GQ457_06G031790 [Hibiscus cannabinus]